MALAVEEDVGRFEVAVDQITGMHILQRLQDLVHHELLVDLLEDVCADDRV